MPRSTPHSRKAVPATAPVATGNGSHHADASMVDSWQRTLDITRTMFGVSLGASQEWMRGLGDLQQAQATALRHAGESIDEIAGQAERASDWPSLWALQASLAGMQWTRAMEDCGELVEQAMKVEARLVERSRAEATRLTQHLLGETNGRDVGESTDAFEANTPLAMLTQAQATMNEMSRLWTQALYNTALPE